MIARNELRLLYRVYPNWLGNLALPPPEVPMITPLLPHSPPAPFDTARPAEDAALRDAARRLEAGFLAAMLQAAGAGTPRDTLGGGVGEDQFSSFLTHLRAEAMVNRGGIGLAETLFNAMKGRDDGRS
jgi:flagellar protein FlgJ